MVDNFLMVSQQVGVLFILIAVGFLCGKVKFINDNSAKKMTDIVLYIVTPCVMINAFQRDFDIKMLYNLGITALCAFAIMIGSIILCSIIFRDKIIARNKVLKFGTVFSNCGFMSLPLQSAILGQDGVFYGSVFVAVFNLLVWTYGLYFMSGSKKELSVKKLCLNHGILGVTAGVLLFLFSIKLPEIVASPVQYLANLNTPIPMLIIGFYLSQSNLKKVFADKWAYLAMAVRLCVIPLVSLSLMYACGVRGDILVACTIAASAPVAATTTMFATKFNKDTELSVNLVSLSTILSIFTMSCIVAITQMIS